MSVNSSLNSSDSTLTLSQYSDDGLAVALDDYESSEAGSDPSESNSTIDSSCLTDSYFEQMDSADEIEFLPNGDQPLHELNVFEELYPIQDGAVAPSNGNIVAIRPEPSGAILAEPDSTYPYLIPPVITVIARQYFDDLSGQDRRFRRLSRCSHRWSDKGWCQHCMDGTHPYDVSLGELPSITDPRQTGKHGQWGSEWTIGFHLRTASHPNYRYISYTFEPEHWTWKVMYDCSHSPPHVIHICYVSHPPVYYDSDY